MPSTLETFLKDAKKLCSSGVCSEECNVVIGNEACDLDSVVCAITYGYCLNQTGSTSIIPVLNIPREDYRLRTEITYTMQRFGINSPDLVFIDELNLKQMSNNKKLTVTLVDHNIIPANQTYLKDCVNEIIDHHKDETYPSSNILKTIEPVGSCSTLVAEKILQKSQTILDDQVTSLLLAAILLDTVNLDPRAGRKTDKDDCVVESLKKNLIQELNCEELYLSVSKAKFDTSTLTSKEILCKDYKAVPRNPKSCLSIGISSMGLSLQSFLAKDNVANDLDEFSKLKGLSVLVVMAMYFEKMDGPPLRQIAVYGPDKDGVSKLSRFLMDKKELDLVSVEMPLDFCACWNQLNVKASRKLVFPLVMEFLDN